MESLGSWECEHCTVVNSGFALECECCLRPRPALANRDLSTTTMLLGGLVGAVSGMRRGRVSDVLRGATNGALLGSIAGNLVELTAGYLLQSSEGDGRGAMAQPTASSSAPSASRVPAASAAINNLPTETITASKQSCPVCLEAFKEGDTARRLPCLHLFHQKCVDTWLRNFSSECPLCKQSI